MAIRSRGFMWTGIGLCVAGAVGLVVGGVLDVDAADPWASVAGGAAGLVGLALAVHGFFGGSPEVPSVTAGGARSIAAGGNIGSASTGDGVTPGAASPPGPSSGAPQARRVTASGERSIAAGGDIGSASTGDA